jgi:hypothetical protein
MGRLVWRESGRFSDLLPRRLRLDCGEAKVVCEFIFLEVCKNYGSKGGEEGGALIDGAVVDRVPYLARSAARHDSKHGSTYSLGASVKDSGSVEVLVVFYGVAVLDDAFSAAVVWGRVI